MRKRYKNKQRSCAMCKPHKMQWDKRWKAKELSEIAQTEKEILEIIKNKKP